MKFFEHGHGFLSHLPFWVQFAIYLFGSEFCLYWIHRTFHGSALWRYHAIHHASEDVEWISAARFHPVNLLLALFPLKSGAVLSPGLYHILYAFTHVLGAFFLFLLIQEMEAA